MAAYTNGYRLSSYEQLVMQAQEIYSKYYGVYARGGSPYQMSEKKPLSADEGGRRLAEMVEKADHIAIGGASGLSASGGGDFCYGDTPSFREHFGKFAQKYGFKGASAGMQHPRKSENERWGYIATFLHTTQTAPVREPYLLLQKLLRGKDCFAITTNQDAQAVKAFPEERVAELQGDHRFFQCSNCCTDDTWDAVKPVQEMIDAMGEGTEVPDELIPRCSHCGAEAFPWVRGYGNLLEGTRCQHEYQKASDWVESVRGKNTLYLELGVGRLTPMFIQEPFWMLVASDPAARYAAINAKQPLVPRAIEGSSLAIEGDITKALRAAAGARKEEACPM